jgi:tRNA threonylcarbamoyladenosine biosynthesis protein TsaB
MRVLAIDTSNDICSVAISEDGKIIDELHNEGEREHSQTLMPMIDEILRRNNLKLDDIDLLGCGTGPGSFTGIRIGIATVKAFNDAKKIPIVGVDALETQSYLAVMEKGNEDCKIISMIDARNDNAYFGIYRLHNGNLSIYKNPGIAMISNIAGYVNFQENVYVVGDVAMDRIESYLKAEMSEENAQAKDTKKYEFVQIKHTFAEAISLIAINKYDRGLYGASNSINPMYLNLSQAEKQKQGITDENIYVNEMSDGDREEIERNYDKFINLWDLKTFEEDTKNSKYYVANERREL